MQRIAALLNKYNNQSASAAELKELLALLEQQEGLLYDEWKNNIAAALLQQNEADDFFDREKNKIRLLGKLDPGVVQLEATFQEGIKMYSWKRGIAVAACVGLMLLAAIFLLKDKTFREAVMAQVEHVPDADSFYAASGQRHIILKDSSEVLLYEGSSLWHDADYNNEYRKLLLKGKARFTVRKNQHKPFMVYTNLDVTTALGTVFEVSGTTDSSMVELMEGSVKVQALHSENPVNIFLRPGETAVTRNGLTVVSTMQPLRDHSKAMARLHAGLKEPFSNLAFKQAPMQKVFKVLEDRYKVRIRFNEEALSGMLFTGNFNETDSIDTILKIIGSINNLKIIASDQGFTVKK